MTETKKEQGEQVRKDTAAKPSPKGGASRPKGQNTNSKAQEDELLDRFDQLGSLMAKGFDLVEAGVELGLFLADRLTTAIQQQAVNRSDMAARAPYDQQPEAPAYGDPGMRPPPAYPQEPPAASEAQASNQINYIINRMPLVPGGPVQVSFTINNDAVSSPKKLRLRVEGFIGEMHGARIDASGFAVKPASKTIAPMDFDKFTLSGAIPPGTPHDAYSGWIIVSEKEGELQIPVRLLVTQ